MDKKTIQLKTIFQKLLRIKSEDGHLKVKLNKHPFWDSLTHIRLILALEKEFKFKIPSHQINKLDTFNKFLEIL